MRALLLVLMLAVAAPVAAQNGYGRGAQKGGGGPSGWQGRNMSREEREGLRRDVDAARGNYGRPDNRPPDRMPPEEREKLRRDVQDANRNLRR
ncbi:MAG: hypothetical protein JO035_17885 [Betaproteobacteria bacterium]|nr:hypothetical protein [Betaproteobacteria bacterium]